MQQHGEKEYGDEEMLNFYLADQNEGFFVSQANTFIVQEEPQQQTGSIYDALLCETTTGT